MAFQLSPGVNVSEIDLTTVVPSVATSIGAFAGKFAWGPVDEIVTISDEVRLVSRFGKPNSDNYEYWFTAANFLAYSNNLKVVRAANTTSTLNATSSGNAVLIKNENDYENNRQGNLETRIIRLSGTVTLSNVSKTVVGSGTNFAGDLQNGDTIVVNEETLTVNVVSSATSMTVEEIPLSNGSNFVLDFITGQGTDGVIAAKYPGALGNSLRVEMADADTYAAWTDYKGFFPSAPDTSDYAAQFNASASDELHIVVIDEDGKFSGVKGTILEKFGFVSKAIDAKTEDGSSNYYVDVLKNRSKYAYLIAHPDYVENWGLRADDGVTFDSLLSAFAESLSGGADGSVTFGDVIDSYDYFVNADTVDVSLILSGPANQTLATALIDDIAEVRRDCVVFLSPERADVVDNYGDESTDVLAYRNTLTSSSYAVMDCNWKYQYDKYNDLYRWVPLNGDIAGLAARTDRDRDPWYSPAGLNRGIIKNVIKLAWNPNKTDRDDLYSKGVNPVVTFAGEGTMLYGDKTLLSRPSAFDRINVRRLFIVLEKAIARAARSSLFEFNDQFTRAQFVSIVEPFLRDVQGRRGITDFRVVCDETNNTGEIIDRNEFVGDIYIKPARSINYIQLNFVAVRTGVSFDEVVGKFG